ncbi:MAG: hypothetical protein L0Y66_17925 [Myxococcaceae bacterium]|nr:hypothetical protein [Myxococcaceae bacterium]MCI0674072.1 hypothetical protein [Myxococcaceae bacterium]
MLGRVRWDDVLGVVAHDLRSPLNTIGTSASLLLRTPSLEEQVTRRHELITRPTSQMDHLIQDLLDVTRIEAGNLGIERRSEDVATLVGEARESLRFPSPAPSRCTDSGWRSLWDGGAMGVARYVRVARRGTGVTVRHTPGPLSVSCSVSAHVARAEGGHSPNTIVQW